MASSFKLTLRPVVVLSVERASAHVPVVDIKYASPVFARVRVQIAKRYKDNYHRDKAHVPAMNLLGFSDPDFNESHEDDMLKLVRPASDRHNDSTFFLVRRLFSFAALCIRSVLH